MLIVNMTVWKSGEALSAFTDSSDHPDVTRRRREWFERHGKAYLVLWWIRGGTVPTVEEANARLERLRGRGPSSDGFTFRPPFPVARLAPGPHVVGGVILIDAANVVGSRPTGWWRDRAGAAAQLVQRIRAATAASSELAPPVVVVLEGKARTGADEGESDGVTVVHARGEADETVVALAAAATEPVTLVTADRDLGRRCRGLGAEVVGPRWLLDRLEA